MKEIMRLKCLINFEIRKSLLISCYIWLEMIVWCFMSFSAIYYGKLFDYNYSKTEEFVSHISGEKGGNWYCHLMFGDLNLTNIETSRQESIQGKSKRTPDAKQTPR